MSAVGAIAGAAKGLPWGKILGYGGTALSVGYTGMDIAGLLDGKRWGDESRSPEEEMRERTILDSRIRSAMGGEQDLITQETSEELLNQMLSPFNGIEGRQKNPVLASMEMDESLRNLLMANEMQLGQMSRPLPGRSFEEIALSMGY